MDSNIRFLRPEVRLRIYRYLTADRSRSKPLAPPQWTDADRAYGFRQGEGYRLHCFEQPQLSGEYIVADSIRMGAEPLTTKEGTVVNIPTVTVYLAALELWPLMEQVPDEE